MLYDLGSAVILALANLLKRVCVTEGSVVKAVKLLPRLKNVDKQQMNVICPNTVMVFQLT